MKKITYICDFCHKEQRVELDAGMMYPEMLGRINLFEACKDCCARAENGLVSHAKEDHWKSHMPLMECRPPVGHQYNEWGCYSNCTGCTSTLNDKKRNDTPPEININK